MKLSYVANNTVSLAQETLSMQWFNAKRAMAKLLKTITSIMVGISIPSIVFQIAAELFNADILSNEPVRTATDVFIKYRITELSVTLVYEISCFLSIFCMLATVFKLIMSKDCKQFGKDIIYLVVGFALITLTKLIPVVLPMLLGRIVLM